MDEIESVLCQYRELCREVDEITGLQHKVREYKEAIMQNWKGPETAALISQLDALDHKFVKISGELMELGHDYLELGTQRG